ncbi:hypothetical protein HY251_15980, partial [bacterium]|nr:hypothetical protein [bacterium]
LAAGALGGALAALVHAFVDFGLELPAIAGVFAATLGIAWGCARHDDRPEDGASFGKEKLRALHVVSAIALAILTMLCLKEAVVAARLDEISALEASFLKDETRVDQKVVREAAYRAKDVLALAPDDCAVEARRARFLATAADLASSSEALPLRLEAVEAARSAARLSPARASAQGTLALKLLEAAHALDVAPVATGARADRSMRAVELRREGEARLVLAFTLGPTYPNLHLAAGHYYLHKTAETGSRRDFELARDHLLRACALQPADAPSYRVSAQKLIDLERPKLGAYASELEAALEGAVPPPRSGGG